MSSGNAERERRREEARLERLKAVQIHQIQQQPRQDTFAEQPFFEPPVQRKNDDKTSRLIKSVLGDYNYVQPTLTNSSLIGVTRTPITPSTPIVTPRDEPFPLLHESVTKSARVNGVHGPASKDQQPTSRSSADKTNGPGAKLNNKHHVKSVDTALQNDKHADGRHYERHRQTGKSHPTHGSHEQRARTSKDAQHGGRSRTKSNDSSSRERSRSVDKSSSSPPQPNSDKTVNNHKSMNGLGPPNGIAKRDVRPKLKVSVENANKYNSHSDLEYILKEMKVNPPLTAINTPRKDESKFSFPAPKDVHHLPSYHNRGKAVQSPIHRKEKPARSDSLLKNDLAVSSSSDESDSESQPSIKAKRPPYNKRYSRSSANNGSDSGSDSDSASSCDGETSAPASPRDHNGDPCTPQRSEDENETEDKNNSPWNLENVIRKINEETAPTSNIPSSSQTDQCNNVTSTVKESSEPQVTSSFPDDVWDIANCKALSPMDFIENGLNCVKQEVPESTVNEPLIPATDSDDCEPDASNIRASGPSSVEVPSSDGEISVPDSIVKNGRVKNRKISPITAPSTTTFNLCHNNNNKVNDNQKKYVTSAGLTTTKSDTSSHESPKSNLVSTFISPSKKQTKPRSDSTPKKETKKRSKKVKSKTYLSSASDSDSDDVAKCHDSKSHQMFIHSIKDMYVPERIAPLKPDSTEEPENPKNTPKHTKNSKANSSPSQKPAATPEKSKKSKGSSPKFDWSLSPGSHKSSKHQYSDKQKYSSKKQTQPAKVVTETNLTADISLSHVFDSVIGSTQGAMLSPLPCNESPVKDPSKKSRRTFSSPRRASTKPFISPVRKLDFDQTSPGHRKARPPDCNERFDPLESVVYKSNGRPSIVVHLSLLLLKRIPGTKHDAAVVIETDEIITRNDAEVDDEDDDEDEEVDGAESEPVADDNEIEDGELKGTEQASEAIVQIDEGEHTSSDMDISNSDDEDGECSGRIESIQPPTFSSSVQEEPDDAIVLEESEPESKPSVPPERLLSSKQLVEQTMQQVLGVESKKSLKPMPKIPKRKHNNEDDNRDVSDRKRFHGDRSPPKHPADMSDRESHEDDHEWDRKQHPRIRDRRGSTSSSSSRLSNRSDGNKRSKYSSSYDRNRRDSRERDYEIRGRDARTSSRDRPERDRPDERTFKKEQAWSGPPVEMNGYRHVMASDRDRDERMETADYYLKEAKKLKHQADSLMQSRIPQGSNNKMDKLAKSLMYVEAVLSFIQCGIAMEHDRISVNMKIFTMFKDTLNLLIHICRFGGSRDPEISYKERKLNILSLRIQSLLCLKLYKLKRKEASSLKKALDDYNKQPHPAPTKPSQAPSPYQTTWNRSTGTPSPMSPTPSPASVGSVGSQGSGDCLPRLTNGNMTSANSVFLPQRIHSVTQQYIQTIDPLHQCHNLWDQADVQALEFKDFFKELNYSCGELTLSSSLQHLVRYVRQGLHRLKDT